MPKYKGELEIDAERGVIYFTPRNGKFAGATILRICRLPKPIPETQLDITWGHGVNWSTHDVQPCPSVSVAPSGMVFKCQRLEGHLGKHQDENGPQW